MVNIWPPHQLFEGVFKALNHLSFGFVVYHEMMHILIFEECLKSFFFLILTRYLFETSLVLSPACRFFECFDQCRACLCFERNHPRILG